MSYKFLNLASEGPIWTLTLSRPEALNALSNGVLEELSSALGEVEKAFPKNCQALIITGAGEKSFVAGADISELAKLSPKEAVKFAEKGQAILRKIEQLPVPVIAAVNGFALGGGLELALACDFIYASDNARMGLPEVSLGLIPGFGGTVRLSRVVGLNIAREMILTGDMVKADQALAWGLVNRVVPQTELLATARKTLESAIAKGPLAVKAAKHAILKTFDQNIDLAMQTEAEVFSELFTTDDVREGTGAFLEKRKAKFAGQ